ncbi:alpha/beta hydrolase family esterase [Actinomyces glycerinitolerans]|uniref:Alpha/beta hydrolase fold n=1 Tax=Actinomyces glycerinitolerans TaxID=1892869 RepID=A0A1M4RYF7_9ACTO|nr:hypothetical protein [Actinomyces glycerinitolerans]SHE24982.1 alpha/beta hydrolase fold [Actinomyces glycerinitolerans]
MTGKSAFIRPGIPDDDNRDYLPNSLKNSSIVVNENGNNSQPFPPRLAECSGEIADGVVDHWYLYAPESYDPTVPVPLVVSLHGGMMTGWAQAVYTSWTNVADREGFIVAFPSAGTRNFWTVDVAAEDVEAFTRPDAEGMYLNTPPANPKDNHDLRFILGLIEQCCQEYSIDRSRVFMQGMSMGNLMTSQFARYFGDVLAGAAGSGGPAKPNLLFDADGRPLNRAGPLAIWQSRLDLDGPPKDAGMPVQEVVRRNREYWLAVNGITEPPAISIRGDDNFAFYRGGHADLVFRDVRNRDHGQTFDDAELVWDYLFSGVRRHENGFIQDTGPSCPRRGDRFAVAVANGCRRAWVCGGVVDLGGEAFTWRKLKYHGLGGDALVRGEYVYVPLSFIASTFDAVLEESEGGAVAVLTLSDGQSLQFARGGIGCVRNGRVTSMLAEAVHRDGRLWISLEWFASYVLELRCSTRDGVLYVTDHHANLSTNMAVLLRDLLV